jgi:hypothetical protein
MHFIKIIPRDPNLILGQGREELAIQTIQEIVPDTGDVDCNSFARLHFADPEEALEALICPDCQSEVAIGPGGEDRAWWTECAAGHYAAVTDRLAYPTPCCGSMVRLDQLRFVPDAGFARYEITINDVSDQLGAEQRQALAAVFGCGITVVCGRYNQ